VNPSLRLDVAGPSLPGAVFHLDGRQALVLVGRDGRCDVVLDSPVVSSRHGSFTVRPDGTGFDFTDLSSTNGSALLAAGLVGAAQVLTAGVPAAVGPGDTLLLGGADNPVTVRIEAGLSPFAAPVVAPQTPQRTILAQAPLANLLSAGEDVLLSLAARALHATSGAELAEAALEMARGLVPGAKWHVQLEAPALVVASGAVAPSTLVEDARKRSDVALMTLNGGEALPQSRSVVATRAVQAVVVPLVVKKARLGLLCGWATAAVFSAQTLKPLSVAASLLAFAVESLSQRLLASEREAQLARDNATLRRRSGTPDVVEPLGNSPAFVAAVDMARRVAPSNVTVLITGETGTGKEVIAHALHRWSGRSSGPFVVFNCAALPESLVESELFGHVRGAFTGAAKDRAGLFEQADAGTLFLDEIGELPATLQAKLLRVLQDGRIRRLGSERETTLDVRIIAATHRDLAAMVSAGTFRQDLLYRLNAVTLRLPPLRERGDDVLGLAHHLLGRIASRDGKHIPGFTAAALGALQGHPFQGNVRELENEIRRAVALTPDGEPVAVEAFSERVTTPPPTPEPAAQAPADVAMPAIAAEVSQWHLKPAVEAFERRIVESAIAACGGNMTAAADKLGVTRPGLYKVIKRLGLTT